MAYVLKDRVRQTSGTVGTGAIFVANAIDGYQTFATALANGDTTFVCCVDGAGNWQTFYATWNETLGSLARTTPVDGSAGAGVDVDFTGQAQVVFIADVATKSQNPHFSTFSLGNTYAVPSGNNKFNAFQTQSISAAGSVYRWGGTVSGTIASGNLTGYYTTALDGDALVMSAGGMTLNYQGHQLSSGWQGGRTTQQSYLNIANAGLPAATGLGSYMVSGSAMVDINASMGGNTGAPRGNAFGRNDRARLLSGGGYHVNSVVSAEFDTGVVEEAEAAWKIGIKVVLESDDTNRGVIADYAYGMSIVTQSGTGATSQGWRIGYALGAYEGWWPLTSSSRVMALVRTASSIAAGAPAYETGGGIDFRGITIGESAFASPGFLVDGSGNAGALTASGVALQTRSAITAKTAVVNTITVVEGGLYVGAITLTCSAPTTSGTTATASVATVSLYANTITARGSGYAVGDTFALVGGTSTVQAIGVVTLVSGGEVFGVKLTTAGNYSVVPSSFTTSTLTGSGSGLELDCARSILTVTVTNAGTNYSEHLPPTITSSGATSTFRQAHFKVTMTATQAELDLNPGGKVKITTHTPSSATDTGTAGMVAWDADYIYVCTGTNTWKRAAIATWP